MSVRRKTLRKRTWQFSETWLMTVELTLSKEVGPCATMVAVRYLAR